MANEAVNFEAIFPHLIDAEGTKLEKLENDSGGLTKFGIDETSHEGVDISKLTIDDAKRIYAKDWSDWNIDALPAQLRYLFFSCAQNCGILFTIKMLQELCKIDKDGIMGPVTIAAAQYVSMQRFADRWEVHYDRVLKTNPQDKKFSDGWYARINNAYQKTKELLKL